MKPTNKLTELACKKANAVGKKLTDGNGMYLLVHKNGSKYWRMDYRFEGKRKTLALGVWPETALLLMLPNRLWPCPLLMRQMNCLIRFIRISWTEAIMGQFVSGKIQLMPLLFCTFLLTKEA